MTREKSSESIDKSQNLDSSVSTPNDQIKKKSKKWNFDFLGSKEEDDLLFEDVYLQTKQAEVAANESLGLEAKRVSRKKKESKIDSVEESIIESDNSFTDSGDKTKEKSSDQETKADSESNLAKNDPPQSDEVDMDGFKVVRAAKTEKAGDLFPKEKEITISLH